MHCNGYREEVDFTYSHSPITDVDGITAGMFAVTTETTARCCRSVGCGRSVNWADLEFFSNSQDFERQSIYGSGSASLDSGERIRPEWPRYRP